MIQFPFWKWKVHGNLAQNELPSIFTEVNTRKKHTRDNFRLFNMNCLMSLCRLAIRIEPWKIILPDYQIFRILQVHLFSVKNFSRIKRVRGYMFNVLMKVKKSARPSVHPYIAHHISEAMHHLIIIFGTCKMMISPSVFFIFFLFDFLDL